MARSTGINRGDGGALATTPKGMQAFLAGSYSKSLERLARWVDAGPGSEEEVHYAEFRARRGLCES